MKRLKTFLFSFIFLFCSLVPCFSVHAQGTEWTSSEKTRFFSEGFYKIVTDIVGLILPTGLGGQDLQNDYKNYVLNNDWIQSNLTYDEWIASQITGAYVSGSSGNSDVTFSAELQNSLHSWANDWIDQNVGYYYGYSTSATSTLYTWTSQQDYDNFISFVRSHDDSILFLWSYKTAGNEHGVLEVYEVSNELDPQFVFASKNSNIYNFYVYSNWQRIKIKDTTYWLYDFTNHVWTSSTPTSTQSFFSCRAYDKGNTYNANDVCILLDSSSSQYQIYKSLSALQSSDVGVQQYYVTDSYNTSNSNNNITTTYSTTTNSVDNSITYGDVQNYVNNYYVENNSYPTSNVVYQYINNYVPPNEDNGGGDNNGGNGGNFDWSFLGTIGDFLAGLLQGLGNALSGILSLLTDIIDMFIGEDGLPNTISQLLGYFLNDFLPPEFLQLIELSIVLMVIVGVIKLIRG